jgi:hypothetical protein
MADNNGWPLSAASKTWLERQARWLGARRLALALGVSAGTVRRALRGGTLYAPTHARIREARR